MVRKTKEDAELTRQQLIDAARCVFSERGVSRSTMEQVACAAGVTRGAVYWHFSNKVELFFAMLDQVTVPLLSNVEDPNLTDMQDDPLQGILRFLIAVFELIERDAATRQAFEIVSAKCEYVDEFTAVPERILLRMDTLTKKLTAAYTRAFERNQLKPGLDPALLALDTCAFFNGLFKIWLVDKEGVLVRRKIPELAHAHVTLRAREPDTLKK